MHRKSTIPKREIEFEDINIEAKIKILAAIPCFNEELTIGTVVLKARKHVEAVLVKIEG